MGYDPHTGKQTLKKFDYWIQKWRKKPKHKEEESDPKCRL